ncbi:MAG: glycosyltransferase [Armatimonadetes bacterium]|nr:glycosyltransferase [Armatimonadota bacterium]NIM23249.1 glycosyltransferase [Armatimonadota bacterium]NIM67117.1 glycosyltransferase [Armatimonadota bacterium]NIM75644.1 glycosyltransferase [Armatimonadota bacterium]NIN05306.1 glycosyltransferase [Armatimonadota bacterium]
MVGGLTWGTFFWILIIFLLIDAVKIYVEIWQRPAIRDFTSDLSNVTALIPTRNGAKVIGPTIRDLLGIGLPKDQILVIDDGSTDNTAEVAKSFEVRCYTIPHMGKVHAIHFGVFRVKTDFVLLLDDDTRVGNLKLPTSLINGFGAVAFVVLPDRRSRHGPKGQSFSSCIQRYEYAKSMEIGRRFLDGTASISCVSGAAGLFRKDRLRALHHSHTGAFEGEDFQRTILEHLHGGNVAFVEEPVWTVAPDTFWKLIRQRILSWYPAHYHMFFNYIKLLFKKGIPGRLRAEMLYNVIVVLGEPLRFFSLIMLLYYGMWDILLLLYALYFLVEIYPFVTVQRRLNTGKRIWVLLIFPVYNFFNMVLRVVAFLVWIWKRFVTGEMKRKTEKDRKWWVSADV